MEDLTRGALAKAAAVHPETIRYYERVGLLPPARRTPAGYRRYTGEAVQRLEFIKQTQGLGFSLSEIAALLQLQFDAHLSCSHLAQQARAKVAEVEAKIASLAAMREHLLALAVQYEGHAQPAPSHCTALLEVSRQGARPGRVRHAPASVPKASAASAATALAPHAGPSLQPRTVRKEKGIS